MSALIAADLAAAAPNAQGLRSAAAILLVRLGLALNVAWLAALAWLPLSFLLR